MEVLDGEETSGNFGPQMAIKVKVVGGKYAASSKWMEQLQKDRRRKPPSRSAQKAAEIFQAAYGDEYDPDMEHDPRELIGKRFMARVGLAGKNQDRNRLEYGTIGPDPNAEAA